MKKTPLLVMVLTILTLSFSLLFSCSKHDDFSEEEMLNRLIDMENIIIHGDINQINSIDPYDEINRNYFIQLSQLKLTVDRIASDNELQNVVSVYKSKLLKSGNLTEGKEGKPRIFSKKEELILKSYVKSLNLNNVISKIRIAEFYINEIRNFNLPEESLQFCLSFLSFHKNFMKFVNIDGKELKSANSVQTQDWAPCAGRDCGDCCMFRKAQSMSNWNWIEWAFFMSHAAVRVAEWYAACLWDCIV